MLQNEPEQRESLESNQAKQPNSMPKNFLVPFLLLCLKDWSLHGYKLIQMLMDIGFSSVDQGNVYRTLRKLEKKPYFFYLGYKRWRAGKKNLFFN
ncbi:PhaQ protein [Bacillus cereus ATCC 14579]|uniref:PhaQ protein n=1 Tax=Bacillus cereus (strain ATCC 14579 / DSM 31 / CCUG 7414 / JCM 2152 / NBRC 15305 / NCIMB 9373 / NCTC 2599 / NRRL B-3711) TaxID=226900 RepID=Q81G93_BACCR|nr:PhaQ protein [Bacillus cereus ATCC 14579]